MTWLQFIASMVGSLAWPLAAVTIAALFRRQIKQLFNKLKQLSFGGATADFSGKLDIIEASAAIAEPQLALVDESGRLREIEQTFSELLKVSPAAAVLQSWEPIELRVRELVPLHPYQPLADSISNLRLMRRISNGIAETLFDLLQLRNAAAHQEGVSAQDAWRFRSLADVALASLRRAQPLEPPPA